MANAYTPGLKVTEATIIRKRRRLPILGDVLVQKGAKVSPDTPVAKAFIPGNPQSINVANILGVEAEDVEHFMQKKPGDTIKKDEVLAIHKAFFGFIKHECRSPVAGTLEHISPVTGQVIVREPAIPIEISAYITGTVVETMDREGVVVETKGAFIQGIFGVGREQEGDIMMIAKSYDEVLDGSKIDASCKGKIIIGGSLMTADAIKKAHEVGAKGIVAGGIIDKDLVEYLGFDIGVAITGHEDIPLTLIVTEGFGKIPMAHKTFDLLNKLNGRRCSLNGATQIRAGVMRPEIIVPNETAQVRKDDGTNDGNMEAGTIIRCIREPYFGQLAEVVDLPPELQVIETGAKVRIMNIKLKDGTVATVPRANVELIEE